MKHNINHRGGSSSPPNKKYSGAAKSALQTIQSFKKAKLTHPSSAHLLSESALMDKETNAIYWQDIETSNILSTSLTRPYLTQKGVVHVRATILFAVIWLWVWGRVSRKLCERYFDQKQTNTREDLAMGATATSASILSSIGNVSFSNTIVQRVWIVIKPIIQFILLTFNALLYLRPPPYSPKFIAATLVLYLLESYGCSTRRYLSRAMNAPTELTEYLESLRSVDPVVKWKVRCFHYEVREIWKLILSSGGLLRTIYGFIGHRNDDEQITSEIDNGIDKYKLGSSPSWMTKKVVTHQAVGSYKFGSCEDFTLATLWKRAQSFTSSDEAPFSKLTLSKLLVLKDRKAREDYFSQQAAFVMLEGRKDVNAEFATSIEVPGFCSKLLAVRPVSQARNISASLFRLHIFYLFTLLGLSLPYRIWFSKHCDEVRVSVVKETSTMSATNEAREDTSSGSEPKSSWLRSKIWGQPSTGSSTSVERHEAQELFRKSMQSFSLYEKSAAISSSNTTDLLRENIETNYDSESTRGSDDDLADELSEEQDYHGETDLIEDEKHLLDNTTLLSNSTSADSKDLAVELPHQSN